MRCKQLLPNGKQCMRTRRNGMSKVICWRDYGMCGKCCKRIHPEVYNRSARFIKAEEVD